MLESGSDEARSHDNDIEEDYILPNEISKTLDNISMRARTPVLTSGKQLFHNAMQSCYRIVLSYSSATIVVGHLL
jgi:hypothetical protein